MAVKIRLLRMGKIRNPQYRIVVADSRTKRDGRAIEYVGIYQPKEDPSIIQVKSERVQYWLSVGAQPSEAVQRLLEKTGDWQQFKGLPAPPPLLVKAEKVSRLATYEAEAKAAAGVADTPASRPAKKASKAAEKPVEKAAEKPVEKAAEKPVEKAFDKLAETVVDKPADKPAETAVDKLAAKLAADKPAESVAEKPAESVAEKPAESVVGKTPAAPEVAASRPSDTKAVNPAEPNRAAVAADAKDPAGAGADGN